MSKWEIQVTHSEHRGSPTGGWLFIDAVAPGERPRRMAALDMEASTAEIEMVARETVDAIARLNAAEVTPAAALEARFWAAVERIKQGKPDLAGSVTKGIRQDAELLWREIRAAQIGECNEMIRLLGDGAYDINIAEYPSMEASAIVAARIRELEAEGEGA